MMKRDAEKGHFTVVGNSKKKIVPEFNQYPTRVQALVNTPNSQLPFTKINEKCSIRENDNDVKHI